MNISEATWDKYKNLGDVLSSYTDKEIIGRKDRHDISHEIIS